MTNRERERFDALLEEAMEALPEHLRPLLDEVPVIVDDKPEKALVETLAKEWGEKVTPEFASEICGLHSGVPLTERSVNESGVLPTDIRLFREGIVNVAGGWEVGDGETDDDVDDSVYDEIMITLLHEIGHHFGLGEEDLEALGYE
jgi:predicted Zn-dependent protease with MMP-like domain